MALPQIPQKARKATLDVLSQYLTEENSDLFVDYMTKRVKRRLPRWLRWLPIRRVLDALLPEVLLGLFEDLLA